MASTRSLAQLRHADAPRFGGKGANLGELLAAGLPVPPGFAICGDAGREEITGRYLKLGEDTPVAVRSSAVGEDSAEATYAGQQDTFLWVRGAEAVCEAVERCRQSLYSERAVSYRKHLGATDPPAMAVVVQAMVDARVAGVMFTCDPVTGDPSVVAINASWGLGETVVSGEVNPDELLVSKVTGEVIRERLGDKRIERVQTSTHEVEPDRRSRRCLSDDDLAALLDLAKKAERHFGGHQDIEWAIAPDGAIYLVQSRPVTAAVKPKAPPPRSALAMVMSTFGVKDPQA